MICLFDVDSDNKKLPFMAMLRNLRNMIKAGISEKHHKFILKKLSDQVRLFGYILIFTW